MMQSQLENERSGLRANLITTDRPDSSQIVDLHIYIVPKTVWKDRQNLAENEAMEQAVSAGFVRVPQNLTIFDLRRHIMDVCGQDEDFPKEFIYLRSVGRCFTKVKPQQEGDLRVKNYRPPMTYAPEIYLLEGHHTDDPTILTNTKSFLFRESPINRSSLNSPQVTTSRQQSWVKPTTTQISSPIIYSSFVRSDERQDSISFNEPATGSLSNFSTASSAYSARGLSKLREEQERLRLRQIELARQRREMEQEQQRRDHQQHETDQEEQKRQAERQRHEMEQEEQKRQRREIEQEEQKRQRREIEQEEQKRQRHEIEQEEQKRREIEQEEQKRQRREIEQEEQKRQAERELHKKQEIASKEKKAKEDAAATRIQATYRGYRQRRQTKERKQELAANEIERLQKEALEFARRKAEEERLEELDAHDIVKLTERLQKLKSNRIELEATREDIARRMQQLLNQITVRREEERDIWKQKYLLEKKKTAALEERTRMTSDDQPDLYAQVEQAKFRLNNHTKLRQQAENECRILKQELEQSRLSMNTSEKHLLPKQPPPPQQQQPTKPISLDIILQY